MSDRPLAQLAKALAAAQAEIRPAAKSRVNPHFKNRYSTLDDIWEAIRAPLSKHGLSVVQFPEAAQGGVGLRTILLHASGESVEGVFVMPVSKGDAQAVGSALSYARRYALAAALGIVSDDDDDGNGAASRPPEQPRRNEPAPPQADAERARITAAIKRHGQDAVKAAVVRLGIKAAGLASATLPDLKRLLGELDAPPMDDDDNPFADAPRTRQPGEDG